MAYGECTLRVHSQLNLNRYALFDLIQSDGTISTLLSVLSHVTRVPAAICGEVAARVAASDSGLTLPATTGMMTHA